MGSIEDFQIRNIMIKEQFPYNPSLLHILAHSYPLSNYLNKVLDFFLYWHGFYLETAIKITSASEIHSTSENPKG